MSPQSSLDRESFQQLLAAAFAVQESRMDTQSLSAVIQIQRLIAAGDPDVDRAMHVISEQTRNVANATGVAIGLLQGRQLVYRAGIGSAAPYVGRHVAATLSVSADTGMDREILRVENAQTDPRIEAAICRQFGAESLLIMPIYQGQVVTGVLDVMFSEAHSFQDHEVRAYRLMAGLIGEALSRAAQLNTENSSVTEPSAVPFTVDPAILPVQALSVGDSSVSEAENKQTIHQMCETALAAAGRLPGFWRLPGAAAMIKQRVNRVPLSISQWSAVLATVVALVIVGWSAHGNRGAVSRGTSAAQTSSAQSVAIDQPTDSAAPKPMAATSDSRLQTGPSAARSTWAAGSAFRRVRVGKNEVDYVANDVTVRVFTSGSSPQRVRAGYNEIEIGKDVTVRYFASNPTVQVTRPMASAAQPVNHTLAEPEKSVSPKLVR